MGNKTTMSFSLYTRSVLAQYTLDCELAYTNAALISLLETVFMFISFWSENSWLGQNFVQIYNS